MFDAITSRIQIPRDKLETASQLGYAAKGIIYMLIGVLSLQLVLSSGGQTAGTKDAVQKIYEQPFGSILLGIVSVGLVCYAIWRFVKAFSSPEGGADDKKVGAFKRVGYLISGVSHTLLAVFGFKLAVTNSAGGGGASTKQQAADQLMSQTAWGEYAIMAVGIGFFIAAGVQFKKAYAPSFLEKLDKSTLGQRAKTWVERIARTGSASRGVTFSIIGVFMLLAGWHSSSDKIKGLSGALSTLLEQPYGGVLLSLVATGLVCYAISCFVKARYRQVAYAS